MTEQTLIDMAANVFELVAWAMCINLLLLVFCLAAYVYVSAKIKQQEKELCERIKKRIEVSRRSKDWPA